MSACSSGIGNMHDDGQPCVPATICMALSLNSSPLDAVLPPVQQLAWLQFPVGKHKQAVASMHSQAAASLGLQLACHQEGPTLAARVADDPLQGAEDDGCLLCMVVGPEVAPTLNAGDGACVDPLQQTGTCVCHRVR